MVLFKKVCLRKDSKEVTLRNLDYDNLKKIMKQNRFNTIILDCTNVNFYSTIVLMM